MSFGRQRLQSLILEVLGAQPSLRDSKTYLSAFGPRPSGSTEALSSSSAPASPHGAPVPVPDVSNGSGSQERVALVKIHGPFTSRQLGSIAEGMAYLKRLGLISIIVVDSHEWAHPPWRFLQDGTPALSPETAEEREFRAWQQAVGGDRSMSKPLDVAIQESLRRRMLSQTFRVAQTLADHGVHARPFPYAILRVNAQATEESRAALAVTAPWAHALAPSSAISRGVQHPSPLVADDQLHALRNALLSDAIPVLPPLALYDSPEPGGGVQTVALSANDFLPNLAREMSLAGSRAASANQSEEIGVDAATGLLNNVDMTPVRLMIINRQGGIPSHARGGYPHLSINLASEYDSIARSFVWRRSHPSSLDELQLARDCLAVMPPSSSGIVVSHRSPRSLIANLITNKAAHSPSLPHRLLAARQDLAHTPTIIRRGLSIRVIQAYDQVDWDRMQALLEASFGRELDREAYLSRLRSSLDFVIVTGDYEGGAIITREWAPGEDRDQVEPIAYLDKFAVLPRLQGSGAVDFLWGALRDEVHGAGLLDALNQNGGLNGFGVGRDLVWKSRATNPVNRWYYERSNGFIKIDTRTPEAKRKDPAPHLDWAMFWCDAEQRLAAMGGEIRPPAQRAQETMQELIDSDALGSPSLTFEPISSTAERSVKSSTANVGASRNANLAPPGSPSVHGAARIPMSVTGDWSHPTLPIDAGKAGSYSPGGLRDRSLGAMEETERGLEQLTPIDPLVAPALLPVVAPDERGRLARWADALSQIPSAWKS